MEKVILIRQVLTFTVISSTSLLRTILYPGSHCIIGTYHRRYKTSTEVGWAKILLLPLQNMPGSVVFMHLDIQRIQNLKRIWWHTTSFSKRMQQQSTFSDQTLLGSRIVVMVSLAFPIVLTLDIHILPCHKMNRQLSKPWYFNWHDLQTQYGREIIRKKWRIDLAIASLSLHSKNRRSSKGHLIFWVKWLLFATSGRTKRKTKLLWVLGWCVCQL